MYMANVQSTFYSSKLPSTEEKSEGGEQGIVHCPAAFSLTQ